MAVEDQRRVAVQTEDVIALGLVEQPRAGDARHLPLLGRPDVDEFKRLTGVEQGFEFGG